MNGPKISIVMASYNQSAYIKEAIESVLSQSYDNKEIIVIDGGSTDGSTEIIRAYQDRLAYWVSEPDSGQSAAFNKGFRVATGDLLTWVNTDDVLLPGALAAVAEIWRRKGEAEWIAGNCVWGDPEGCIIRCTRGTGWWPILAKVGLVNVSAPSSFFTKRLLDSVGGMDEDCHYMMDTELWRRFARAGAKYTRVNRYMWMLRLHPEAKMSGHHFADSEFAALDHPSWAAKKAERERIMKTYGISKRRELVAPALSRAIRLATLRTPLSIVDTKRFGGKSWREVFQDQEKAASH